MTRVYRVLRALYARSPLDGEGSFRFGGRWSSPGTRLAYTSQHLSLAMLEYLVHLERRHLPKDLVQVAAEIPADVTRMVLSPNQLPANWRETPEPPDVSVFGDEFVSKGRAAILVVPSALVSTESNWLINPLHPDFSRIRIHAPEPCAYDPRLRK